MSAEPLPIEIDEPPATIKIAEEPIIADRSTLEPYLACPLGARLKADLVSSTGLIAITGSESHAAISSAIREYVESESGMAPRDLRNIIESGTWAARADVQPDVIASTKFALYSLAETISNVSVSSILAFDGGNDIWVPDIELVATANATLTDEDTTIVLDLATFDGGDLKPGFLAVAYGIPNGTTIVSADPELGTVVLSRPAMSSRTIRVSFSKHISRSLSGQLDVDIPYGRQVVRLTAEMDFLHSTKTPGLLMLHDWKSGWSSWTEAKVAASFQFQVYSLLVLETYPEIEAVDVIIHDTRKSNKTMPCRFFRSDVDRIKARVLTAIHDFMANRGRPLGDVEARPSREACRLCSAASMCSLADLPAPSRGQKKALCDEDIRQIKADPESAVDRLYVLTRAVKEIEDTLKPILTHRFIMGKGGEIRTKNGNVYGYDKSKKSTKPKPALYGTSKDDEEAPTEE